MNHSTSKEEEAFFDEEAILTEASQAFAKFKNKSGRIIISIDPITSKPSLKWKINTTLVTSPTEDNEWDLVDNVESQSVFRCSPEEEIPLDCIEINVGNIREITHLLPHESSVKVREDDGQWFFKFNNNKILDRFLFILAECREQLKSCTNEDSINCYFDWFNDTELNLHSTIIGIVDPQQPLEQNTDSLKTPNDSSDLPIQEICKREEPLSLAKWITFKDLQGTINDVIMVKKIIFKGGIAPEIQKELWKYLLGYYKWEHNYRQQEEWRIVWTKEYYRLKLQWKQNGSVVKRHLKDISKSILRDVMRTDRDLGYFSGDDNPNLEKLNDILMTYCAIYSPELSYVQGMDTMLSPLVYVLDDEVDSFWCFVGFMNIVGSNFELSQSFMKTQLAAVFTLISFIHPNFAKYLRLKKCEEMVFCFRWLLVWFRRELSMKNTITLWEVLWTNLPCENFYLLICVSLLESQHTIFMENDYGADEILQHVQNMSNSIDIPKILNDAECIYHQIIALNNIPEGVIKILGLSKKKPSN